MRHIVQGTAAGAARSAAKSAARLAAVATLTALGASGCATLSQSSTQEIVVLAYDQRDRPVTGMTCTLNNGAGEARFSTPANSVTVRRHYADLEIECTRGGDAAKGTVVARRENLEQALVPFGWVAVGVDHLTGHLYAYPDVVRLRVGQHLRYEFSREARAAGVIATLGQEADSADLQAAPRVVAMPIAAPAPTAQPVAAANGRAARAGTVTATRAPAATSVTPAAPVRSAPVRSAPLTW
jgi:hypothetical protein